MASEQLLFFIPAYYNVLYKTAHPHNAHPCTVGGRERAPCPIFAKGGAENRCAQDTEARREGCPQVQHTSPAQAGARRGNLASFPSHGQNAKTARRPSAHGRFLHNWRQCRVRTITDAPHLRSAAAPDVKPAEGLRKGATLRRPLYGYSGRTATQMPTSHGPSGGQPSMSWYSS